MTGIPGDRHGRADLRHASHIRQIPREFENATVIGGAMRWQALCRVIVPFAIPGIFTVAILGLSFC